LIGDPNKDGREYEDDESMSFLLPGANPRRAKILRRLS
jgi:hypothetical protein